MLLAVVSNWSYFYKNLKYQLSHKPTVIENSSVEPGEPNILIIESLDIRAPIQYVDETSEDAFQEALKNGVVHYPGTANPGENGNAYIFGHSSDYIFSKGNYKTVFALLPRIKIGDEILITDKQGKKFIYHVTKKLVVNPNDLSVLDQFENKQKLLSLQTSYPIGTALKRYVVVAETQ